MTPEAPSRSSILILKLIAAATLVLLVWLLSDVLLMVFAAILLAIAYRGSAEWISRHTGLSVTWALVLLALVAAAVIGGLIWWSGSTLLAQLGELWSQLSGQIATIRAELQKTEWGRLAVEYLDRQKIASGAEALAGQFAGAALGTLGVVGATIIVVATAVYLAAEPEPYQRGCIRLLAIDYRPRGAQVLAEIGDALRMWLVGRAIDMVAVVALTFAGLLLLGVPLAFLLALIAGLLNFVPYIGAVLGAIPAVLIALGQGPTQALWVALLFLAIQNIEGYLLVPFIQQRTVRLPPALTILSQTVFGTLFGLLGLLLAPALMVVIMIVVQSVYLHDVLGDRDIART